MSMCPPCLLLVPLPLKKTNPWTSTLFKAECSGIVEEAGAVAVEAVVGEEVMDESHDAAKAAVQEIVEGVSV
jgi:hypothetical protein